MQFLMTFQFGFRKKDAWQEAESTMEVILLRNAYKALMEI